MTEQLQFDFMKTIHNVQGNHSTLYINREVFDGIMKNMLALKEANDILADDLREVDAVVPILDKLLNTDTYSEDDVDKARAFVSEWF